MAKKKPIFMAVKTDDSAITATFTKIIAILIHSCLHARVHFSTVIVRLDQVTSLTPAILQNICGRAHLHRR